jgi:hypothetical protein
MTSTSSHHHINRSITLLYHRTILSFLLRQNFKLDASAASIPSATVDQPLLFYVNFTDTSSSPSIASIHQYDKRFPTANITAAVCATHSSCRHGNAPNTGIQRLEQCAV